MTEKPIYTWHFQHPDGFFGESGIADGIVECQIELQKRFPPNYLTDWDTSIVRTCGDEKTVVWERHTETNIQPEWYLEGHGK